MDTQQFTQFMELQQKILDKMSINVAPSSSSSSVNVGTNIALVPNFEPFDTSKESFRNYKLRFENYTRMKYVHSNKEYCAKLLLNSIGAKSFNIVTALAAPKNTNEMTYEELVNLLQTHLSPQKNVLVAQHQFLSKYQAEHQTIAEYVAALRTDIGDCEFDCECKKSVANIFLRAQFIRGIKDNGIREILLQSNEQIADFSNIVSKAIALEAAKSDSKEIAQKMHQSPSIEINRIFTKKSPKKYGNKPNLKSKREASIDFKSLGLDGLCLRCGKNNHYAKDCHSNKSHLKCAECKKTGHVIKVCIQARMKQRNAQKCSTNQIDEIHQYGVLSVVNTLQTASSNCDRFFVTVGIQGSPIKFEIDTGSGYTFLPRDKFAELNLNVPLLPTKISFQSYTREVFIPDGKIEVDGEYNGKRITDEIYIVPENYTALLGRNWIRKLNINLNGFNSIFSINNIIDIDAVLKNFQDIFQPRIGCANEYKISLKLREKATPVFNRERDIPYAIIAKVNQELDQLEASGVITKTEISDWGSPLVVIPKSDGSLRLCVDYKVGVNERLIDAHNPIRKIEDIFNCVRNSMYFCRLDLYKAYLHIPVDDESSKIQTMSTHRGTYKVNRLSFGIKTAPSEFNRVINQILQDVPKTEAYFDDIIVHGSTKAECIENLSKCLRQLQKHDLHLNKGKCSFLQEQIEFLGHTIKYNTIQKSKNKISAITDLPQPVNADDLKRFLGMVTYYSRFIPNCSSLTFPLRCLVKQHVKFCWNTKCEAAFQKIKQEIASDRVLVPYDPECPVQLACDASPVGIAGVLSHIIGGEDRPISFASRSLTDAERNYSQIHREALAIVFSVDRFYQYLYGRPFTLVTDNQPLVRIFHQHAKLPQMTFARLQRYAAFLSGFNYQVQYKKGIENINADCLSRAPIKLSSGTDSAINEEVNQLCEAVIEQISTLKLNYKTLQAETQKDQELLQLVQNLQNNQVEDTTFTLNNGILFRGQRAVIPISLQQSVMEELHQTHIGISKMKQLARRYVYWKSIDKDIEHLVKGCASCGAIKSCLPKVQLHTWDEPTHNWQRIHIDYAGLFQGHYFLVVMDAKSKWAEIGLTTLAPTSSSTMGILSDLFARHGYPDVIVSDNASIFTSDEFQRYCKDRGIFQKFIAPGHPATNGLAERNVQTLKNRLKAMADDPRTIREKVRDILFRYRATPLGDDTTPSEKYLNRQMRIQLDALRPPQIHTQPHWDQCKARQLFEGDRVQARFYENNKSFWKLGTVLKKYGHLHYLIKLDDGHTLKRHINQLRSSEIKRDIISDMQQPTSPRAPNEYSMLQDLVEFPVDQERQSDTPENLTPVRRSTRRRREPVRLNL